MTDVFVIIIQAVIAETQTSIHRLYPTHNGNVRGYG